MTVREFISERSKGAVKIAKEARAKGGLSLLTAVHFEAKAPAYALAREVCLKRSAGDALKDLQEFEQQAASVIADAVSMDQFQTYTGKQEVYGEIIHFLQHGVLAQARKLGLI